MDACNPAIVIGTADRNFHVYDLTAGLSKCLAKYILQIIRRDAYQYFMIKMDLLLVVLREDVQLKISRRWGIRLSTKFF